MRKLNEGINEWMNWKNLSSCSVGEMGIVGYKCKLIYDSHHLSIYNINGYIYIPMFLGFDLFLIQPGRFSFSFSFSLFLFLPNHGHTPHHITMLPDHVYHVSVMYRRSKSILLCNKKCFVLLHGESISETPQVCNIIIIHGRVFGA